MLETQLIGAWELTGFEARAGEAVTYPYSESAVGLLCYTADGYVFAFLAHPAFRTLTSVTAEAALMSSAYSARWRLEGDTVFHDVLFSNVPALIGTTLTRGIVQPTPDTLELRTLEKLDFYAGAQQILKWTRRSA